MTGAIELPEGKEMVMPGDNVSITVKLIAPSPWKKVCASLSKVAEGWRCGKNIAVGAGVVAKNHCLKTM